ncbi:hypothetical protein FQN54_002720 [Arachnomyces sp. PD_36]|nr:hypothetical protein FQN54_002720 [Arachnomyces sp. PD_36]
MAAPESKHALNDNFNVDYVIRFRYADIDPSEATDQLKKLLQALANVGLQSEVRNGDKTYLLVFVRASEPRLRKAIYRSRIKDWLHGVSHAQPESNSDESVKPQSDAERLRTINNMITLPENEGGANITPKYGEWENVESIFPLHDNAVNKEWIKNWSTKTLLTKEDLDQIRDKLGESIGFYFSFLQSYFVFLTFPAAFGFSCWVLLGHFSIVYALVNGLGCIIFVEYWKRQEVDLRLRWQVKGVSELRTKRRDFKAEKEVKDDVTGEIIPVFPITKRTARQLLQVPFALVAIIALGTLIATCFGIEIFISEVYDGPLKSILVFIPTVLLSLFVPTISAILTSVGERLNAYENYETQDSYDVAMTQKIFVLNFIVSYLPIFLTAFVYVPFGSLIVPYLDVFHLTVKPFVSEKEQVTFDTNEFQINPSRLRKQVIYFTVTAQVVNLAMETVVPYLKRKLLQKYKSYSEERENNGKGKGNGRSSPPLVDDPPGELEFLTRVRNEADLSDYDVTNDLREMCIQFGYLSLFSPVWPLVPLSFLVNNWIELRSDFFKICIECRRPTPWRADSIGPWLDSLGFLTWLGSITSAALVYLFSNDGLGPDGTPAQIKGWGLLLAIFFSEHLYLLVRYAVQVFMSKIETPSTRKERAKQYLLRKGYLDASVDAEKKATQVEGGVDGVDEKITHASLEEDARTASLHGTGSADRFWAQQKGWKESAQVGAGIIEAYARAKKEAEEKKEQ